MVYPFISTDPWPPSPKVYHPARLHQHNRPHFCHRTVIRVCQTTGNHYKAIVSPHQACLLEHTSWEPIFCCEKIILPWNDPCSLCFSPPPLSRITEDSEPYGTATPLTGTVDRKRHKHGPKANLGHQESNKCLWLAVIVVIFSLVAAVVCTVCLHDYMEASPQVQNYSTAISYRFRKKRGVNVYDHRLLKEQMITEVIFP